MSRRVAINRKRRPTHPGTLLRMDVLPDAGLTQTKLAAMMGVSRRVVNELCREQRALSTDLAHRLARVFGNTPEFWLRMQQAVDLWDELHAHKQEYDRITPLTRATASTSNKQAHAS
jgi:addiction module HigA family antidote